MNLGPIARLGNVLRWVSLIPMIVRSIGTRLMSRPWRMRKLLRLCRRILFLRGSWLAFSLTYRWLSRACNGRCLTVSRNRVSRCIRNMIRICRDRFGVSLRGRIRRCVSKSLMSNRYIVTLLMRPVLLMVSVSLRWCRYYRSYVTWRRQLMLIARRWRLPFKLRIMVIRPRYALVILCIMLRRAFISSIRVRWCHTRLMTVLVMLLLYRWLLCTICLILTCRMALPTGRNLVLSD